MTKISPWFYFFGWNFINLRWFVYIFRRGMFQRENQIFCDEPHNKIFMTRFSGGKNLLNFFCFINGKTLLF